MAGSTPWQKDVLSGRLVACSTRRTPCFACAAPIITRGRFVPRCRVFLLGGLTHGRQIVHAAFIMAHEDVSCVDGVTHLGIERVGDGAGHSRGHGHGYESSVNLVPVGEAKGDVACPANGVAAQFFANHAHELKEVGAGAVHGAHGHCQRVKQYILALDAIALGALDNLRAQQGGALWGHTKYPIHHCRCR